MKKRRMLKIHLRIIDSFPIIVYLLPTDFLWSLFNQQVKSGEKKW